MLAILLYYFLYLIGEIKVLPTVENIVAWDAINYYNIQHRGYIDFQEPTSNIPFFPLVALIWKTLNLQPLAASFLNAMYFLIGLFCLHRYYKFSLQTLLLYLSLPSIFFFFVPYAEALFFISSVLVILGLEKKHRLWIISGLFIAAMTRPSAMFFFPVIIFVEVMALERWSWKFIKKALVNILLFFLPIIVGLTIVFWIQYEATGDWLAFFHQRKDNHFKLPVFPLTTWRGAKLLWLDGFAFSIAFASVLFCAKVFFEKIRNVKITPPSRAILFALGFLSMTVVHIILFNGKENSPKTSLFGLNRFVFATAFLILIFHYFKDRFDFSQKKNLRLLIGYFILILAMIGVFIPDNQPEYLRPTVYLLLMMLYLIYQNKVKYFWFLIFAVNMTCQVLLFDKFLRGIWVG